MKPYCLKCMFSKNVYEYYLFTCYFHINLHTDSLLHLANLIVNYKKIANRLSKPNVTS